VTNKELVELLIGDQPADEIINDRGDCIVAPETIVEGFLFVPWAIACAPALQDRNSRSASIENDVFKNVCRLCIA
jgi:hypothetical protein